MPHHTNQGGLGMMPNNEDKEVSWNLYATKTGGKDAALVDEMVGRSNVLAMHGS